MRCSLVRILILLVVFLPPGTSAQETLVVNRAQREARLNGYTRAYTTVTLSAEVSGKIVERNYDIGQVVGKAPFFVIDTTFIDFQIASIRQQLKQLQISLQMKRSRMIFLKKEYDRIRELFQRNSTAGSKRDLAEEEYTQSQLEMDTTAVQIAQAKTSLAELEERRRRHWIYALSGWHVTGRLAEAGEIVGINAPLASVGDYRTLVVPLALSADEFTALQLLGSSFDAVLEGNPVQASVLRVDPQFDDKTRKINLELEVNGYTGDHRGGLRFTLPLQVSGEGLQVPKAAVIKRYENPRVKIKSTGEEVAIVILGETSDYLTVGENRKLIPGTELARP